MRGGERQVKIIESYPTLKIFIVINGTPAIIEDLKGQERADYDAFLINACQVLSSEGFTSMEEHQSNKSGVSYYITAVNTSELEEDDLKVVLFIRLSDHPINMGHKKVASRRNYYDNQAQKIKTPTDKEHQDWEFLNIIIKTENEEITCNSYRATLKVLKEQLQEFKSNEWEKSINGET